MVPFDLEVDLEGKAETLTVEQLERFADIGGYSRYDVHTEGRRSVIYVNVTDDEPFRVGYDDNEVFNSNECKLIANAIRVYNNEAKVVFAQFLLDF